METLQIALIQSPLTWENPSENRNYFTQLFQQLAPQTQLVILPEMFTTGFTMNAKTYAETQQGDTITWLKQQAQKHQIAIAGSLIISEHKNYYNRLVFISPNGTIQHYNKRHSFSLAGEQKIYTAGHTQQIITYNGWKICPQICYDLRFPVWSRNTSNYHLLLYVANWPAQRTTAWDTLLQARAIENLCYCIGVNRVGTDANGHNYLGHSIVHNALGQPITPVQNKDGKIITATLYKNHLEDTRKKLPFLNDKDQFEILD